MGAALRAAQGRRVGPESVVGGRTGPPDTVAGTAVGIVPPGSVHRHIHRDSTRPDELGVVLVAADRGVIMRPAPVQCLLARHPVRDPTHRLDQAYAVDRRLDQVVRYEVETDTG